MQASFDAFEYFDYLRTRWGFIGGCCLTAVVLAGSITFLLPKRYTATASILIDAPAGNDPRAATAVSPIYLESLKTYEHLASSDSLFLRAIELFKLRDEAGSTPADALKRRVLQVTKPRDTKLLEISVTWADPQKAQAVAQFIAEETVNLNRSLARQSDDDFTTEARRQLEAARSRLEQAEKDLLEAGKRPVEALRSEVEGLSRVKAGLQRELIAARIDSADPTAIAGLGSRIGTLQHEIDSLDVQIATKEVELNQRQSRLDRLSADRRTARASYDAAATHVNDAELAIGARGERLKIIDPGIVPQQPSSPNLTRNIAAALLVALAAAILYLTVTFSAQSRWRIHAARPAYR